jgi:hypothetical protein
MREKREIAQNFFVRAAARVSTAFLRGRRAKKIFRQGPKRTKSLTVFLRVRARNRSEEGAFAALAPG